MQAQAGLFPGNGAQQGGAGGIVHVGGAGLVIDGGVHELPDPVRTVAGHGVHAAAHAQHVADGEQPEVFAGPGRRLLRENVDQALIQPQQSLCVGDAHGCGRVSLGVALQAVAHVGAEGGPPSLGAELAAAHDHQAMHLGFAGFQGVDIGEDVLAAYAHSLRRGGFKRLISFHMSVPPRQPLTPPTTMPLMSSP